MTSQDNEDDNDKKLSPVPALLTFTNTSDCLPEEACISPSFAGGRDGTYWSLPVKGKRTRNQPELLKSPKNSDTSTYKRTLPSVKDNDTCTIFFTEERLHFLELFVEALICPSCKLVKKLVPLSDNKSLDYLDHY